MIDNLFGKMMDFLHDEVIFKDKVYWDILTFEDFMSYYYAEKANIPGAEKFGVEIKRIKKGYQVVQVFLDKNSKPIRADENNYTGRRIVAKELDSKLIVFMNNKNFKIFDEDSI